MEVRVARAAARVDGGASGGDHAPPSGHGLRPDQARVFRDFATFLLDVATRPAAAEGPESRFGRIILPPRTGKTVIAAHILARCALSATFIVPTRTLVAQTARELSRRMSGVPIGVYSGERKDLVSGGVNVATYAILLRDHARGALPDPIARSALVFADEAHRAMTAARMALLARAFAPGAVRVALTATPDYDDDRLLCRFFPHLIHEVTLEEALALDLLAPARVWVAEVDAEGSRVRILAGDYEEATLGRVMSAAPFSRAVEVFRYDGPNARLPALIACASRQQAHDLTQYLAAHRPPGAPAPELVLGDTSAADRTRILAGFEAGVVDTLVQVGVLVEGWSSPRCKLLLDLAPTLSRVRATQKYFRALTRYEGREARIYVLLPKGLPELPILPMELFGRSCREYTSGELLGRAGEAGGGDATLDRTPGTPIAGVTLKKRIVLSARLEAPKLDGANVADVRAVLSASRDFAPPAPCNLLEFRSARFEHPLFSGRGSSLLRWLGVPSTIAGYAALLSRAFPEGAAHRLLLEHADVQELPSCREDAEHLLGALHRDVDAADPGRGRSRRDEGFGEGFRALTGAGGLAPEAAPDPLQRLLRLEEAGELACLLWTLPRRHRIAVARTYGLLDEPEEPSSRIAADLGVSTARVNQLVSRGLRRLRGRAQYEGQALRLIESQAPPPHVAAWRQRARECLPWAVREHDRDRAPPWVELAAPLPVRALLPRLGALLERLGLSPSVTAVEPSLRTWSDGGVMVGEAVWEDGGLRVELSRSGHARQRHEGGEAAVLWLWAEVSGLPGAARLVLEGRIGHLEAFAVEDDSTGAVEAIWRDLSGLAPRLRDRGRSRRSEVRKT
jgi:hypothetical protein